MGTFRVITKKAGALRPFVKAVRGVERESASGGVLVVLDGEPAATGRLRDVLGVDPDVPLRGGDGFLVHAAVAGHDPTLAAAVLAGAKREGRGVLALVVGTAGERAALERVFLQHRPLEPGNIAHLLTLTDSRAVTLAVARSLGGDMLAAGRRYPALRDAVADTVIARAARQAATVGVAVVVPGADMPVITLIQARLVAQLAALHGRPLDSRRGLEIGGVLVGAFGWRAIARKASDTVPVAGFAVRGGVAYSGTRAVGEAARAYFVQVGDRADQPLDGLHRALKKAAERKGRK